MQKIAKKLWAVLKTLLLWLPILLFGSIGISAVLGLLFEKGEYDYDSMCKISLLEPENSNYTSGDSITDVILNYYSGISDLPEEMKAELYKNFLLQNSTQNGYEKKLKGKSPKEILNYFENRKICIEEHFRGFPDTIENSSYYQFVWNTYFLCGSPKIRFSSKMPFPFSKTNATAYYNPFSEILFLGSVTPVYSSEIDDEEYFYWSPREFLEELSHGKQFKEKPFTSYSGASWGLMRSFYSSLKTRVNPFEEDCDWEDSYADEYWINGSFEYEAHKTIFPYIFETGCVVGEGLIK